MIEIQISEVAPFEVRCNQTGDTAFADSPEAAIVAAKTLGEDAYLVSGIAVQGRKLTFRFTNGGECIASATPEAALWRYAL